MRLHTIKNYTFTLLSVLFLAGFSVSANAHTEGLADWKGTWISAVSLLNTPSIDSALQTTYDELGKKDGVTGQAWKANKLSKWNTAIKGMTIDDNTITFTLSDGSQVSGKYT